MPTIVVLGLSFGHARVAEMSTPSQRERDSDANVRVSCLAARAAYDRYMRRRALVTLLVAALGCGDDGSSADGARPVTELEGVPYAATCETDEECGGEEDSCCTDGKCSPDGWCSPRCESDQDCPEDFFCVDHDGSRCFSACADDRDCPEDFICEEKSGHLTCRFK